MGDVEAVHRRILGRFVGGFRRFGDWGFRRVFRGCLWLCDIVRLFAWLWWGLVVVDGGTLVALSALAKNRGKIGMDGERHGLSSSPTGTEKVPKHSLVCC